MVIYSASDARELELCDFTARAQTNQAQSGIRIHTKNREDYCDQVSSQDIRVNPSSHLFIVSIPRTRPFGYYLLKLGHFKAPFTNFNVATDPQRRRLILSFRLQSQLLLPTRSLPLPGNDDDPFRIIIERSPPSISIGLTRQQQLPRIVYKASVRDHDRSPKSLPIHTNYAANHIKYLDSRRVMLTNERDIS